MSGNNDDKSKNQPIERRRIDSMQGAHQMKPVATASSNTKTTITKPIPSNSDNINKKSGK